MCTVGGRIEWIGTRSGTARWPGIADPTTLPPLIFFKEKESMTRTPRFVQKSIKAKTN